MRRRRSLAGLGRAVPWWEAQEAGLGRPSQTPSLAPALPSRCADPGLGRVASARRRGRAGRGRGAASPGRGAGRALRGDRRPRRERAQPRRDARAPRTPPPAAGPAVGLDRAAAAAAGPWRRRALERPGPGGGGGGGRVPRGGRRGRAGPAQQAPVHGRHVHARDPERRALRHVLRALVTPRRPAPCPAPAASGGVGRLCPRAGVPGGGPRGRRRLGSAACALRARGSGFRAAGRGHWGRGDPAGSVLRLGGVGRGRRGSGPGAGDGRGPRAWGSGLGGVSAADRALAADVALGGRGGAGGGGGPRGAAGKSPPCVALLNSTPSWTSAPREGNVGSSPFRAAGSPDVTPRSLPRAPNFLCRPDARPARGPRALTGAALLLPRPPGSAGTLRRRARPLPEALIEKQNSGKCRFPLCACFMG